MKEFRVAKCLVNGEIAEYAIFADSSRMKIIKTHPQYGKYFEVDNELNTECDSFLRFYYSGRIKDAVEMIRNGNGDCIAVSNSMIKFDSVLYFLDRQIGEALRQKTLDELKDAKFGWAIECGNIDDLAGFQILNKKNERIALFGEERNPMIFDTKESADEYVESLIVRSKYYAKRLVNNIYGITDENERDKIIKNTIDEIENDTKTKFSVITDFTFDMLASNCEPKSPEYNLDEMRYRVIQYIIQ